jgi:hypothetical protein
MLSFMMTPDRAVGHLDADCFYVSAERVRDEFLRDKPVGVLGNQGACVIAKSYEMKASGVGTGMPIWDALDRCPTGVYLKRDFRWYEVLSRLMLEVTREFSDRVEYYSIDEFFFRAIRLRGKDFQQTAEAIRDAIWERLGVPVTVGIARSRTLAKLISDAAKPFGALAVTEITGIAGRRERRLAPWGIRTCRDLAEADRRLVRGLLTASGESLWWELNGEAVHPIQPERPVQRVLSRGGSFGEPATDPIVLYAWLVRNLERLIEELRFHRICAGRLTVWVSYRNGEVGVGQANPAVPTDRFDLLLDAARVCLRRAYVPRTPATRMHVIAERLVRHASSPRGLFESSDAADQAEAVARLKELINHRHGRFALRSAATLPLVEVYRDSANGFDICDIRGKFCF